ncbi:Nonribosomal Peptide Synthase (NRPS) [Penicillium taxi]|uniref:Nonribosomal Peptide Synthase (NRPS) n=1 Tax=Penicillium taxi TaxID=168475 RepID=UPI00254500A1|nr:Nonribosomal Peptide Synthase (NRPS) [Penicillium taxi]KAJ5887386.1 Nonribosomal Peptide Synthase (NRPS) [Penicillium taxi]
MEIRSLSNKDHDIIIEWNKDHTSAINECVHEIVQKNAASDPENPAVHGWDASFTYQQLNELSDKLAILLLSHGINSDSNQFVLLCFEKSAWTVISMLAVLKSGAAFVPIDPNYPLQRRESIIEQTNACVILASPKNVALFQRTGAIVIDVSQSTIADLPPSVVNFQVAVEFSPFNAAYRIFTSGSTGSPKAVVVEQSALTTSGFYHDGRLGPLRLASGMIHLIGRKDTQTKLRGQRLELGEVEFQVKRFLSEDRDWQVAVDIIRPSELQENSTLAAFISSNDFCLGNSESQILISQFDALLDIAQNFRLALEQVLPAYMIPSLFIQISSMPSTASGKTDRCKLLQLGQSLSTDQLDFCSFSKRSHREPSTTMEFKLQELWAKVLHIEPSFIAAEDTFFRLGGDSILAMRLVATAREMNIYLLVTDVLQKPRLYDMVAAAKSRIPEITSPKNHKNGSSVIMPRDISSSLVEALSLEISISVDNVEDICEATKFQA